MLETEGRTQWEAGPSRGLTWNYTGTGRKALPPPRLEGRMRDWTGPGLGDETREQIAGPRLRQEACFPGNREEEPTAVLAPLWSDRLQENQGGVIAASLQSAGRTSLGRGRVLWGPPPPSP